VAAAAPGSCRGDRSIPVDPHLVEPGHVQQQAALADVVGRPAMATRADPDLEVLPPGERDGFDDVVHVDWLNHHLRQLSGVTLVEERFHDGLAEASIVPIENGPLSTPRTHERLPSASKVGLILPHPEFSREAGPAAARGTLRAAAAVE